MLRVSDLNCFTVENLLLARLQLLLTLILKPLGALGLEEKCLPSSSVNIPLTQTEEREIYEIHMFNTFHFVPGICIAYRSILGSKHFV